MFNLTKLLCFAVILSFVGCKDVLTKPLTTLDRPNSPESLEGVWVAQSSDEQLEIRKTNQADWYQFKWQQKERITEGRFVVAYFSRKQVLNIDLTSVRVDGQSVVTESQSAFLLVGAFLDSEEMRLVPADMKRFEQHFAKYFYASPIIVGDLCANKNPECMTSFDAGKMLIAKRSRKFNDDFVKQFRSIFPRKQQIIYIRK